MVYEGMDSSGTHCAFRRDVYSRSVGSREDLKEGFRRPIEVDVKIPRDQDPRSASVATRMFWVSKRVQKEWRIYPIA